MRVSASKTGLLPYCGYFAREGVEWAEGTSEAADRGTRFHAAIAEYVRCGTRTQGLADDIVGLYAQAERWVDEILTTHLRAEKAYGWDPVTDTATAIEATDRDYSGYPGHLCGTVDLVSLSPQLRTGMVWDWKTGDSSQAGPQLRALGLMVARAHGLDSVTVAALEVTDEGVRETLRETLDGFALSVIAGELADALAQVPTATPTPGDHCAALYCPARVACPTTQAAVAQLVPVESLTRKLSTHIESPDHAAWMLDQVRRVESACKAVKEAIKGAVPADGWALENGARLVEATREVTRFDKSRALGLLRELGATDEQIAGLSYFCQESNGLRVVGGPGVVKAKPRARKGKAA